MVQILPKRPRFGDRFVETFQPSFQKGLERFLGDEATREKEERKLAQQKATARALNLPEVPMEPSVMAALVKEQKKQERIDKILNKFRGVSPESGMGDSEEIIEGEQVQSPGGLSDDFIFELGLEAPQAASLLQQQKEAGEKKKQRREDVEREPLKKSTEAFFTKLNEDAEKLPLLDLSISSMIDAVKSGEVDPFSSAHLGDIATALGVPKELSRILETPGSKEFKTARKQFLSSTLKEAFRGTTTGREIDLAESLLAEVGLTKEANLAASFLLKSDLLLRQEKQRLAKEARQKGISNYEVPDYVSERLEPYRKKIHDDYMAAVKELRKRAKKK